MRKALRAPGIAGAKLQHRQQRIAHQRVDLVDQQHQRSRRRLRPTRKRFAQCLVRSDPRQKVRPDVVQKAVVQRRPRLRRQPCEHRAHGPLHVVARGAGGFDGNVQAPVSPAVQHIGQRQQRRCLAGLARRMEHEVLLVAHQAERFVQIDPRQRRDQVMIGRIDGTGGVERTHGFDPRWAAAGFARHYGAECITGAWRAVATRGVSVCNAGGQEVADFYAASATEFARLSEGRVEAPPSATSPPTTTRRCRR